MMKRWLTLLLLLYAWPVWGQVTFGSATTNGAGGEQGVSSSTVSVTTSGANRLVGVCIALESSTAPTTVTGVTYNGVALTQLATVLQSGAFDNRADFWYSATEPAATTANVVASYSAATDATVIAMTFNGVDTTTPLGTHDTNGQPSGTPSPSIVTVTGVTDGMVVDCFTNAESQAITPGGGQTERADIDNGGSFQTSASTSVATGSVAMSEAYTVENRLAHIGVPILPAAGAPAAETGFLRRRN